MPLAIATIMGREKKKILHRQFNGTAKQQSRVMHRRSIILAIAITLERV